MNPDPCPRTEEVVHAIHSGNWPADLQTHIDTCEPCRETSRVACWITEMAAGLESASGELPDPRLTWLKAKIKRRSLLYARALLPLKVGSLFGVAGFTLLLSEVPASVWNRIQGWRPGDLALGLFQELLGAAPAVSWWIPVAAVLLYLFVFATNEA